MFCCYWWCSFTDEEAGGGAGGISFVCWLHWTDKWVLRFFQNSSFCRCACLSSGESPSSLQISIFFLLHGKTDTINASLFLPVSKWSAQHNVWTHWRSDEKWEVISKNDTILHYIGSQYIAVTSNNVDVSDVSHRTSPSVITLYWFEVTLVLYLT